MSMLGLKGLIVLEAGGVSDLITEDVFSLPVSIPEQIEKKEGVKA